MSRYHVDVDDPTRQPMLTWWQWRRDRLRWQATPLLVWMGWVTGHVKSRCPSSGAQEVFGPCAGLRCRYCGYCVGHCQCEEP